MIKNYLPAFLTSLILVLVASAFLLTSQNVSAAATHVVISEVQLGVTGASTNEFVELYNPTGVAANLQDWKFSKKNTAGTVEDFLVATLSGTIPAHGYFLIGSEAYNSVATVSADVTYSTASASLTNDNTILLYDSTNTVVDKLGLGGAVDNETATETNPSAGTSRERQALSSSTNLTMAIGGTDEFLGNGEDTDNNATNFVSRAIPQPQNVESELEPVLASPTPTATATASPTSTPTETPAESPTASPTATPSPTATASPTESATPAVSPTASPTESATPTATASPTTTATPTVTASPTATASPTLEPTATPSPTPTATATASPTSSPSATPSESPTASPSATATASASPTATAIASPTATPFEFPIAQFNLMCSVRFKTLRFGFTSIQFPIFSCRFVRV